LIKRGSIEMRKQLAVVFVAGVLLVACLYLVYAVIDQAMSDGR
jgi:hypothetical protein